MKAYPIRTNGEIYEPELTEERMKSMGHNHRKEKEQECNCNRPYEIELTEQEWIQTADTEQLAEFLADVCYGLLDDVWGNDGDTSCDYRETEKNYWVEWLKQPHTNE